MLTHSNVVVTYLFSSLLNSSLLPKDCNKLLNHPKLQEANYKQVVGACVLIVSASNLIYDNQYQVLLLQHGYLQLHNLEKV